MSFEEVYRKYYNELRRFGRQLNISVEKCEDLVQETFLKYYLELKKEVIFDNPRAWLYKVFLNLFKTDINSNRNELPYEESAGIIIAATADTHEVFAENEKHRIVIEMLERLSKHDKEILILYNNGFSYSEMAEILEINPNSVGKTIVRSIEKLKELLKNRYHEMFE
jgi:RNA polymerase sigma-70 factor, ECF subfamily